MKFLSRIVSRYSLINHYKIPANNSGIFNIGIAENRSNRIINIKHKLQSRKKYFLHNSMLNFLTTFGAETQFERNRLLLTKHNYDAPNEQAMKNILHSFAGQDEQTRAQIAFACIIKKIHKSPGRENWIYLLKNLIILDRVMSDNRFCQELAQTTLQTVSQYFDKDFKSQAIGARNLLTGFWLLIQEICRCKISKQNILHYKRSERKEYLERLSTKQIFRQIKNLQALFENCLFLIFLTCGISKSRQKFMRRTQVISEKQRKYYNQFCNSGLAEYLNIHFYSKLLTFFSCQYLCIHKFIQIILHTAKTEKKVNVSVSIEEAKVFKKMIYKFKSNCLEMKYLVERNKHKKGFENIDGNEFSAFSQTHIIKAIDEYINQNSTIQEYQLHSGLPLLRENQTTRQKFVDRKPLIFSRFSGSARRTPRRCISCKPDPEKQKLFIDYFNSYSDEFPHKSMMTLDLIEDIRKDEQRTYRQILDSTEINHFRSKKNLPILQPNYQESFLSKFKKQIRSKKLKDILILSKDLEKEDQKEDSTSYSNLNSSRSASLFDLLNIKWQTQKSQA